MAYKKAFTLAEILIVLMVIGVIATLTIPSMMKGVFDGQVKAGYKKAYNNIASITYASKMAGELPVTNVSADTLRLFHVLANNLDAKNYVSTTTSQINSGVIVKASDYKTAVKINGHIYGSGESLSEDITDYSITTYGPSPWIITEDNMAYSVMCGGGTGQPDQCGTKDEISGQTSQKNAAMKSCAVIVVDINGLSKGPNAFDPQVGPAENPRINEFTSTITAKDSLKTLTGDQYLIFIGSDGATPGPKQTTVSGRIMGDLR